MQTSFANAAQVSVSYCKPSANRDAPLKAPKWLFRDDTSLLFMPQFDLRQWQGGLRSTNIPYIGQTPVKKPWVNHRHSTLGRAHGAGSGKALAELYSGQTSDMAFRFYGVQILGFDKLQFC